MIGAKPRRVDRRLLVGGAGVAGVVLGWVVLVAVFGGSGDPGAVAPPRSAASVVAAPNHTVPPAPVVAYVPASRDPFHQNVTVPRAPAPGHASAPAVPTATTPASRPQTDKGAKANVELKSVAPDGAGVVRATITVDGQPYRPAKGETFSHGYRLERIDGNCVEVSAQAVRAQMCVPATNG